MEGVLEQGAKNMYLGLHNRRGYEDGKAVQ
jgi:hypothetical protein